MGAGRHTYARGTGSLFGGIGVGRGSGSPRGPRPAFSGPAEVPQWACWACCVCAGLVLMVAVGILVMGLFLGYILARRHVSVPGMLMSFMRGASDPTGTYDAVGYGSSGYFYSTATMDPYASTWYLGQLFSNSRVQQVATTALEGVLSLIPRR